MASLLFPSQKALLFSVYQESEGSSESVWSEVARDTAERIRDRRNANGEIKKMGAGIAARVSETLSRKGLMTIQWEAQDKERPLEGRPHLMYALTEAGVEITPLVFLQDAITKADTIDDVQGALATDLGQLILPKLQANQTLLDRLES